LLEEESGFLIQNVQVSQLFVESIYDTRDSKILTRKGHLFRTKASVSHFLMKRQPGFLRLEGGIRKFIPIKRFGVLAFQMKSGSIFNASEDPVPLEERFFFSGNTNVRGYPKNFIGPKTTAGTPYGGEYFYLLRSELRIHIWHALWSKFFFDNGGIYRNITTSSWEGSANGLGTGIRILYGIWSARLEYAWKLEGNKFQPGRWYFELGQEF
jgi:outer membrane protein assembly factor BamA